MGMNLPILKSLTSFYYMCRQLGADFSITVSSEQKNVELHSRYLSVITYDEAVMSCRGCMLSVVNAEKCVGTYCTVAIFTNQTDESYVQSL